jgi:putative oxidoreductase
MKIAAIIARTLLGLGFIVFGLNGFLHFIPMPPMSGPPGDFFNATAVESHYFLMVAFFQVLGGLLALSGRFTPLGLTILAGILVNILTFHITLTGGAGIVNGVVFGVLELFCIYAYRANFAGIFGAAIAE